MGMFDKELLKIRGYRFKNDDNYYVGDVVFNGKDELINALISIVSTLASAKYPNADISDEIAALPNLKWGSDIRKTIYTMMKKLADQTNKFLYRELTLIRTAHFGRDMREPLYDILIKLGAGENLYYPTTGDDYIYTIDNGVATLELYKGSNHPYLTIPQYVKDGNDNDIQVTTLSCMLFSEMKWLQGVYIPEGVTTIE